MLHVAFDKKKTKYVYCAYNIFYIVSLSYRVDGEKGGGCYKLLYAQ